MANDRADFSFGGCRRCCRGSISFYVLVSGFTRCNFISHVTQQFSEVGRNLLKFDFGMDQDTGDFLGHVKCVILWHNVANMI